MANTQAAGNTGEAAVSADLERHRLRPTHAGTPESHQLFAEAILDKLLKRDPDGTLFGASPTDVDQAAELATDRILDPALLWVEHLGAFYDTFAVRSLLGREGEPVTRQAVHKRKGLMALTTGSGSVVYPAFQFHGRQLVHGLERVMAELPESLVSRWTLASWLVSPERDLDDERPIDVLDQGEGSVDAVVQVARTWAAQLAS
ncbi:MAG: hypothetical protein ACOH1Y_09280 [Propionicimonas sp.]